METRDVPSVLDELLGLEPALVSLVALAQRLQQSRDPIVKAGADNMRRHARGEQVSIALVKQQLQQSMR